MLFVLFSIVPSHIQSLFNLTDATRKTLVILITLEKRIQNSFSPRGHKSFTFHWIKGSCREGVLLQTGEVILDATVGEIDRHSCPSSCTGSHCCPVNNCPAGLTPSFAICSILWILGNLTRLTPSTFNQPLDMRGRKIHHAVFQTRRKDVVLLCLGQTLWYKMYIKAY